MSDKPIGNIVHILNNLVKVYPNKNKIIKMIDEYNKTNEYHLIWVFNEDMMKINVIEDPSFEIFLNEEKWYCKFINNATPPKPKKSNKLHSFLIF